MTNYKNAKIYKLVSNVTDEVYYGSTTQSLAMRKANHKSNYKLWKEGKYNNVTSFQLFELGDVDIILVEELSCETKEQLHARERFYIENNDCLNRYIPGRTEKEYHKHYGKEYREKNKDKIKRQYKEKVTCECGSIVTKSKLFRHKKSKKHQEYVNSLS